MVLIDQFLDAANWYYFGGFIFLMSVVMIPIMSNTLKMEGVNLNVNTRIAITAIIPMILCFRPVNGSMKGRAVFVAIPS